MRRGSLVISHEHGRCISVRMVADLDRGVRFCDLAYGQVVKPWQKSQINTTPNLAVV